MITIQCKAQDHQPNIVQLLVLTTPKFMPDLGEHSREILLENGFSDEKIRELSENQIIAVR